MGQVKLGFVILQAGGVAPQASWLPDSWLSESSLRNALFAQGILLIMRVLFALVFAYTGHRLIMVLGRWVRTRFERKRIDHDPTLVDFAVRTVRYVALAFVWAMALGMVGIDIGPFIASLGVTGFVVGFAFKDALGNFAAGLLVMVYRPFKLGDVVEVSGVQGTVEEINIVATVLRAEDGRKVFMPNSKVWGNAIVNFSAYTLRRVEVKFTMNPTLDLSEVLKACQRLLEDLPGVVSRIPSEVKAMEVTDQGPIIALVSWTEPDDLWEVTTSLRKNVEGFQKAPEPEPGAS